MRSAVLVLALLALAGCQDGGPAVLESTSCGGGAVTVQTGAGPQCAIWLDGVGNPHNFGAIARSAAHFGAAGILLPQDSTLSLSGAAARVAEGGIEALPLVRLGRRAQRARQPDLVPALGRQHQRSGLA